jgi:adenylate cyclase class IV
MSHKLVLKCKCDRLDEIADYVQKECKPDHDELTYQTDTHFAIKEGCLKLREEKGKTTLIHYFRSNDLIARSLTYSLEPILDATSKIGELTKIYDIQGIMKKRRRLFICSQTEIHLDMVQNVGSFLELEVNVQDASEESTTVINQWCDRLKLDQSTFLCCTYADICNKTENKL